ncbi:hypothetical protein EB796_000464 [Bugula neritina]|uniref:Uncharacterized protein n=1 Tax=Bugula neritina TaxID=10212 RepID=A0A7J7KT10_BUGNE|nr:hypothetical protein EB796_000464 [Bugula neritina]
MGSKSWLAYEFVAAVFRSLTFVFKLKHIYNLLYILTRFHNSPNVQCALLNNLFKCLIGMFIIPSCYSLIE